MSPRTLVSGLVVLALIPVLRRVASGEEPAAKKDDGGPAVHRVRKEPFRVEVELKGVFEAEKMTEVALRLEEWSQLDVLGAVEAGRRVEKGDRLVELDRAGIDRAIDDLEAAIDLSGLSIRQAEEQLKLLDASLPLDLAAAKRSAEKADQDLLRFLKTERPLSVKSAENRYRNAKNYLEYELEELRQLEKMYKADDLTEETEEIILKRQRDTVERLKFSLESAKVLKDRTLEVDLPRQERGLEEAARRNTLSWEKARKTLPLAVERDRLELTKSQREEKRSRERLAKLRRDRDLMEATSPAGGIVYYGRCVRGTWEGATSAEGKLRRGGSIQPNDVFMTVVEPRPLRIRASVPEAELHRLRPGVKGSAIPTGFPDLKLPVRIEDVAAIPRGSEGFDTRVVMLSDADAPRLMPGMTCTMRFVPYERKKAITVPPGAVFSDEAEDDEQYVYVRIGAGHEKRSVEVGRKTGEKVEILDGLEAGDEVLLEKPPE